MQANKAPEEAFLLQAVEQMIVGPVVDQASNTKMSFVKFVFHKFGSTDQESVIVRFPEEEDFTQFINKVKLIVKNKWQQEPSQFIMQQNTELQASEHIRNRHYPYPWVESHRRQLIQQLSMAMRQNHTGFAVQNQDELPINDVDDETEVEWVKSL